jgi:hypothetical protein
MLVRAKNKVVIGSSVYQKGDVFEFSDRHASIYVATHLLDKAGPNDKANKESPKAATTGVSINPNKPSELPKEKPASKLVRTTALAPGEKKPPLAAKKDDKQKTNDGKQQTGSGVGAMSQDQGAPRTPVKDSVGGPQTQVSIGSTPIKESDMPKSSRTPPGTSTPSQPASDSTSSTGPAPASAPSTQTTTSKK